MTIARFINDVLLWLTLLAFVAQCIIDFTTENITANCIILVSILTTLLYLRWSTALTTHPLSSFAIFGFCVTSELGALLAQSSAWTAVGTGLHSPLVTFTMLTLYQAVVLVAHTLYRILTKSSSCKQGFLRNTFQTFGIYATPTAFNLWIMGGIGAVSLLLANYSPVANGFSFLAWAPFLIPIYVKQSGSGYCNVRRNYLALLAYAMLIALNAMAINSRGIMFAGIATVALLFLLVGMRTTTPITKPLLFKLGIFGLMGAALSWPASNMVTAMVIARSDRGKASSTEMVKKSLDNFQNPQKLADYRKQALANDLRGAYDEKYINNPMLARFVTTKFHDNAIYFAGKIPDKDVDNIMNITGDYFLATLPQPWLDALKIDVKKQEMNFSMGDVLTHFAVGTPIGGSRTGSIFGQGSVLFGNLFPVIYFVMCLILFSAIDIFSIQTVSGEVKLSVIGMLNVWPNFIFGITSDSLHALFMAVARGVAQTVLLYSIAFVIAKFISNATITMLGVKKAWVVAK